MNKEFIEYMKEKIANVDNTFEAELNTTLLNLYKKGLVTVEMRDGEAFISVSDEGKKTMLEEVAISLASAGEA
jgi:ribonuclease HIII